MNVPCIFGFKSGATCDEPLAGVGFAVSSIWSAFCAMSLALHMAQAPLYCRAAAFFACLLA